MDNQDKLYEQFQQAAQKAEGKDFAAMEKVWARVEEKLDKKKDRKAIVLWQKLAIVASLLLFFTLGYQFLNNDPNPAPNNQVVVETPAETKTEVIVIENKSGKEVIDKPHVEKVLLEKSPEQGVAVNESASKGKDSVFSTNKVTFTEANKDAGIVHNATVNVSKATNALLINEAVLSENNIQTNDTEIAVTEVITNPITGEKTITGVVTDNTNLPLPGVAVTIKGTITGTQTDFDGRFSIKVLPGNQLEFSYIGFKSNIVTVGKSNKINVAMQEDVQSLQEVVMVSEGYNRGRTKKAKTSKTKQDKTVAFQERPNTSFLQSLQGQTPGLNILSSAGSPGSAKIEAHIRGLSSLKNNHQPLIVVDGVPISNEQFSTLDQNDIETITVLGDAAATSLYGNRGSNGVLTVTTKKGTHQKLSKKALRKKLQELKKQLPAEETKPVDVSQEDYESFIENQFESPTSKPLSTFSIDVDYASYTNVRRFINNGQTVPKDAVRVEEMVNFFKYDYPQPKSNNPFSINTEYSEAPWNPKHKILRIGLQGKIIPTDALPASNLVFLIDVSGSMNDANKLPLLKESMKILVEELRKKDKVSIVVYAGAAGLVLPPTSGDDKRTIIDALNKLSAGGSTAGGAGIDLAYKIAAENFIKNGNNRVILATDGDFNVGGSSNADMQTLIEEKRKTGVFLTCLGYGMGNYKDSKMEILSDKGNGNYAYIDNIQEANRFLGKEFKGSMFAIAKDVKIQIEFNPKHVQSYRLIGYENRKLRDEDFANDAIDAGELGSGHTVTALYEIIPTGVESAFLQNTSELKYTKVENNANAYNDELATIKFRHKKPDGDTSIETVHVIENKAVALQNASADFKFSTAVAWFGLKLRDSKLVPNKDAEAIKKLAKQGLENDPDGYRAEFIRLVETVK